jgi:hypothetical protein
MSEPTIAELERRYKEAEAAHLALLDEQAALTEAQRALHPKRKVAARAAAAARAAWETARRGGPLEPAEVAEALHQAGYNDPASLFVFERAVYLAPLPYAVWVRPLTREGQRLPWGRVRDAVRDAGYEVRQAPQKRYPLKGEKTTGWYQAIAVRRPVLEEHLTAAEDEAAWPEEVATMAEAAD